MTDPPDKITTRRLQDRERGRRRRERKRGNKYCYLVELDRQEVFFLLRDHPFPRGKKPPTGRAFKQLVSRAIEALIKKDTK